MIAGLHKTTISGPPVEEPSPPGASCNKKKGEEEKKPGPSVSGSQLSLVVVGADATFVRAVA